MITNTVVAAHATCPECHATLAFGRKGHSRAACVSARGRRRRREVGMNPERRGHVGTPWTAERLRARTTVSGSGCWLWRGGIRPNGYGHACLNGQGTSPHRLSWRIFHGPIPPGLYVCHSCDIRHCVNPDHLFLGTPTDNMRDAARKGRTLKGDANPKRRTRGITESMEREILARRRGGEQGLALAREYGVSTSLVSKIYRSSLC